MKIPKILLILLLFTLFFNIGYFYKYDSSNYAVASTTAVEVVDPIAQKIKKMTLEEKIGQMFLVGVYADNSNQILEDLIKSKKIGSVILMSKNVVGKNVSEVTSRLQSVSTSTNKIPLFISIDQEGGIVARIKEPGSNLTSQPEIKSSSQAYDVAKERGSELVSKGVSVNFSPVLEYITASSSFLYKRVFRGSKVDVISYGNSMVKGYRDSGIIPVIKHFPGHDNNSVDSHKSLPISKVTNKNFNEFTSVFRSVIKEENPPMIMMSHVFFPNIDKTYPATLSSTIVSKLRKEYGYKGIIITDDMNMGAITKNYGVEKGAVRAVVAGNDLLLYVASVEVINKAQGALILAVKNKQLTEKRIDESVYRVLSLKERLVK